MIQGEDKLISNTNTGNDELRTTPSFLNRSMDDRGDSVRCKAHKPKVNENRPDKPFDLPSQHVMQDATQQCWSVNVANTVTATLNGAESCCNTRNEWQRSKLVNSFIASCTKLR